MERTNKTKYKFEKSEFDRILERYRNTHNHLKLQNDILPFLSYYAKRFVTDEDMRQEFLMYALTKLKSCAECFMRSKLHKDFGPYLVSFFRNAKNNIYRQHCCPTKLKEITIGHEDLLAQKTYYKHSRDHLHLEYKVDFKKQKRDILNFINNMCMLDKVILKLYHTLPLQGDEISYLQTQAINASKLQKFHEKINYKRQMYAKRTHALQQKAQNVSLALRLQEQDSWSKPCSQKSKLEGKKVNLQKSYKKLLQYHTASLRDISNLLGISKTKIYRRLQVQYRYLAREYQNSPFEYHLFLTLDDNAQHKATCQYSKKI